MGAAKSNQSAPDSVSGRFDSGKRLDRFEKRIDPATRNDEPTIRKKYRGAAL